MIQIDMNIPKTCDDCPFHIYHSGKNYVCVATPLFYPMNLANYKGGRKDFCPLIEVAQEPILEKVNKMKSEIADSLEFWDYSPNNNPLARDILETLTNFWGNMREVEE